MGQTKTQKTRRRFLAGLLSLAMLAGLFVGMPMTTFAATITELDSGGTGTALTPVTVATDENYFTVAQLAAALPETVSLKTDGAALSVDVTGWTGSYDPATTGSAQTLTATLNEETITTAGHTLGVSITVAVTLDAVQTDPALPGAKTTAIAALDARVSTRTAADYTAASWTTFTDAVDAARSAIGALTTVAAVTSYDYSVVNAAEAGLVTKAAELAAAKTAAIADVDTHVTTELDGGVEANYTVGTWAALQTAITNTKNAIEALTVLADVTGYDDYDAIDAAIGNLMTLAQELAAAKVAAKAAVDAYVAEELDGGVEANYTAATWTALQTAITDTKNAIEALTVLADVTGYNNYDAIDTAIGNLMTPAQELAAAKTAAKAALDARVAAKTAADYTAASWTDFTDAVAAAKSAIDDLTTVAAVNTYDDSAVDTAEADLMAMSFTIVLVNNNLNTGEGDAELDVNVDAGVAGATVEITFDVGDTSGKDVNLMGLTFGAATPGQVITSANVPAKVDYVINSGDAVNGVITITADFYHSDAFALVSAPDGSHGTAYTGTGYVEITFNAPFAAFVSLEDGDGVTLELNDDYTVRAGSTIIRFSDAYRQSALGSVGTYNFVAHFDANGDGTEDSNVPFNVVRVNPTPPAQSEAAQVTAVTTPAPQTGDGSSIVLWVVLLALACAGGVTLVLLRKRIFAAQEK